MYLTSTGIVFIQDETHWYSCCPNSWSYSLEFDTKQAPCVMLVYKWATMQYLSVMNLSSVHGFYCKLVSLYEFMCKQRQLRPDSELAQADQYFLFAKPTVYESYGILR